VTLQVAVRSCLRQYLSSDGRAGRAEYWWWQLAMLLIGIVLGFATAGLTPLLGLPPVLAPAAGLLCLLGLLAPCLAVTVRRLHDSGMATAWLLLAFVPLGGVVLLVFMLLPGDHDPNRYGPPPGSAAGPEVGPRPDGYFGIETRPAAPATSVAAHRPDPVRHPGLYRAYGPMPRPEGYRATPRGPQQVAR
jgi:uncharacterized membrane protein YhaH (DUF805 family)